MRNSITVTGIFDGDAGIAQSLEGLRRLSIPVWNISVLNVNFKNLRVIDAARLLAVHPEGRVISIFGLSGATAGAVFLVCATLLSPPWGLLKGLGFFTSLGVGAVLGCMLGSLVGCAVGSAVAQVSKSARTNEGKLASNKNAIVVQVPEQSPQVQAVKTILQEYGAAVTVEAVHRKPDS
jgi:hypothetical protein